MSKPSAQQYMYETGEGMWSRLVDTWFYQKCSSGADDSPEARVPVDASANSTCTLPEVLSSDRKVSPHPSSLPLSPHTTRNPYPAPHPNRFCVFVFFVLCLASRVSRLASRISHLTSRISRLASCVSHLASRILRLISRIVSRRMSRISHLASSHISHLASRILNRSFIVSASRVSPQPLHRTLSCTAPYPAPRRAAPPGQGELRQMIIEALGGNDGRVHLLEATRQEVLWLPFELAGSLAFDRPYNVEDLFIFPEVVKGLVRSCSYASLTRHTEHCGLCNGCGLLSLVPVDHQIFQNLASTLSSATSYASYTGSSDLLSWHFEPCAGCVAAGDALTPVPPGSLSHLCVAAGDAPSRSTSVRSADTPLVWRTHLRAAWQTANFTGPYDPPGEDGQCVSHTLSFLSSKYSLCEDETADMAETASHRTLQAFHEWCSQNDVKLYLLVEEEHKGSKAAAQPTLAFCAGPSHREAISSVVVYTRSDTHVRVLTWSNSVDAFNFVKNTTGQSAPPALMVDQARRDYRAGSCLAITHISHCTRVTCITRITRVTRAARIARTTCITCATVITRITRLTRITRITRIACHTHTTHITHITRHTHTTHTTRITRITRVTRATRGTRVTRIAPSFVTTPRVCTCERGRSALDLKPPPPKKNKKKTGLSRWVQQEQLRPRLGGLARSLRQSARLASSRVHVPPPQEGLRISPSSNRAVASQRRPPGTDCFHQCGQQE